MGIRLLARFPWLWSAVVTTLTAVIGGTLFAQSLSEHEAKIACLYNFAKFVEWPADVLPPRAPISFCVIGDSALAFDLQEAARGREVGGHKVAVSAVNTDSPLRGCHLLYLTGLDQKRTEHVLATTAGTPTFTVSDTPRFAERGGVATLAFDSGRMRFAFNVNTAQRAHLAISSRLLALATIIKDAQ